MSTITGKLKPIAGLVLMITMGCAFAGSDAGMVKEVKGTAMIVRGNQKFPAKLETPVQVSDMVTTGTDGSVGITLQDGTMLSAGSNSILALNKFLFNSTTHKGVLDTSLKRGTLAVVSGKLSKASPDAVTYRTPTAIIGVRGTEFVIEAGSTEK